MSSSLHGLIQNKVPKNFVELCWFHCRKFLAQFSSFALAECAGRICSRSLDGSICVWGGATLEYVRTLRDEENEDGDVRSLAAWEGHLISGHGSGVIRVWNVATGVRDRVLEGHTGNSIVWLCRGHVWLADRVTSPSRC